MQFFNFFFIGSLTVLVYCCSLCQSFECTVLTENEGFFNYLIKTTDENYTITAICKCTVKVPKWKQLNNDGEYDDVVLQDYVMKIDTDKIMIDYTVTDSSILVCGNSDGNYARAISIVLEKPQEECISNDTIKQSSTVMLQPTSTVTLQQSTSTVTLQQSSSTLSPFTQSSTISDDIISSSLSSRSHEDSCTEWQTQTTTKTVETTLTVTPTTLVSRIIPQMTSPTSERNTLIYAGSSVGAGVIAILVVIILVLLASLMVVIKKKNNNEYKVDNEKGLSGPSEPFVAINHTVADHQLHTNGDTSNQQHDSPSSKQHEDEQSNTDNPSE